jgi:hypothetical protein
VHRPVPGPDAVSRRRVLVAGGRSVLALALVAAAASACGSAAQGPDPLEAELAAARKDSELAAAAAKAALPAIAPALSVVADERSRHATALVEELARAAGKPTPTSSGPDGTTPTAASSAPPAPPGPPPSVQDVIVALRRSADSAATLAPTLSGYRAGLLGSIAAACTASYTWGLLIPKDPPR